MTEPTNADRAAWAACALDAFRAAHNPDGDLQTDIKDLITDLLHLARLEAGVTDVEDFAARAARMASDEADEDSDGGEDAACQNCGNTLNDGSDICDQCGGHFA